MVHILEDKEGGASEEIAFVWPRDDDLLEFNNIRVVYLL